MYIGNYHRRSKAVFLSILLLLFLCGARLFFIQLFRSNYLAGLARKQHNLFVELEPLRGTIYDARLRPQAMNVPAESLYASPNEIKDKQEVILGLSKILHLDKDYLNDRLNRKKSFIWIARKIPASEVEEIKSLNIKGLGFLKESRRSYQNGYLASHIIGFAGLDNVGLEGLEAYYNEYLKGIEGWAVFLRDARQKKLDLWERMVLPKDGYDLVLTIDEVIQFIAERELDKAFKTYHAKGASIIVMDPHTGAILAMASRPTYDLNNYSMVSKDQMRNRAICDLFEPGSVFKIVTLSAALQEGKINEEEKIFCENGSFKVATHILHDHRPHGWLTFREVIEQSSNIGTTKAAMLIGQDVLYKYIKLFGFGGKLNIDLIGEVRGVVKEPRNWSKISISAIPIGQEVGVTLLQLASAISVIANGGDLMRPFVVQEIRDKHGETIKKFSPKKLNEVISPESAFRAKEVLKGVVERGTGKLAKVPEFSVAGKTGTAQKIEPDGRYSHSKFVATFIGFAPADDPIVAIAIMVDEPRPYYFGGVVAAPVFKNVARDSVKYLKARNLMDNFNQ